MESLQETGRLGKLGQPRETNYYDRLPDWVKFAPHLTVSYLHFAGLTIVFNTLIMHTFDTFNKIYTMLEATPSLSSAIGMEKAMTFVHLATRLKDEVLSKQKVGHDTLNDPPDVLPGNVKEFLSSAIDLPDEYVDGCWMAFRRTIWQRDANGDSIGVDAKLFREHGLQGLMCELSTYSIMCCCLLVQPLNSNPHPLSTNTGMHQPWLP
jgi:hypothetical protein